MKVLMLFLLAMIMAGGAQAQELTCTLALAAQ